MRVKKDTHKLPLGRTCAKMCTKSVKKCTKGAKTCKKVLFYSRWRLNKFV